MWAAEEWWTWSTGALVTHSSRCSLVPRQKLCTKPGCRSAQSGCSVDRERPVSHLSCARWEQLYRVQRARPVLTAWEGLLLFGALSWVCFPAHTFLRHHVVLLGWHLLSRKDPYCPHRVPIISLLTAEESEAQTCTGAWSSHQVGGGLSGHMLQSPHEVTRSNPMLNAVWQPLKDSELYRHFTRDPGHLRSSHVGLWLTGSSTGTCVELVRAPLRSGLESLSLHGQPGDTQLHSCSEYRNGPIRPFDSGNVFHPDCRI